MNIKAEQCRYGSVGWASNLELFAQVATNPKQWLGTAQQHIYAAQVLLPHINQRQEKINEMFKTRQSVFLAPYLDANFFLLCALATENALKSVIAYRLEEKVKSEIQAKSKIPNVLLGHNLVVLAGRAGYRIDLNQEYVLRFLSRYGIWGGKYPLPIHNDDNAPTKRLSDGDFYMVGGYNPKNVPKFLSFCNDLYHWASTEINNGI